MGQELFDRLIVLKVGRPGSSKGIELTTQRVDSKNVGFDIEFTVNRSLKREPNTAEITVYNLSPSIAEEISQQRFAPVELEFGYRGQNGLGQTGLIFKGDLFDVNTTRKGADLMTTLSPGDGLLAKRSGRVNKSFPKGTSVRTVIEQVVQALTDENLVGLGNVRETLSELRLEDVGDTFAGGTVAYGPALDVLERLYRSAGYELSIQDNKLQALPIGEPLSRRGLVLSADTGLISAETVSTRGLVKAQTLIAPELFPGRVVIFENIRGFDENVEYRIEKVDYSGSNFQSACYADLELKKTGITRARK